MTKEDLEREILKLNQFVIELDLDPISAGPLALANKIAVCANFKNAVTEMRSNTLKHKHRLTQAVKVARSLYQMEIDSLTTSDPDIKNLPSISDRQAAARIRLRPKLESVETMESELETVTVLHDVVQLRHRELADTMRSLASQKALVLGDIRHLGGGWRLRPSGSSPESGSPVKDELTLEPPPDYEAPKS